MTKEELDFYVVKIKLFTENSKSYIQIGSGILAISITALSVFNEKSISTFNVDCNLRLAWILILISIGVGLLYQYLAIKKIEAIYDNRTPSFFINRLDLPFAVMLFTFYLGLVFFVISAFGQI